MKLRFMLHFLLKTNMSMYIVFRRKKKHKASLRYEYRFLHHLKNCRNSFLPTYLLTNPPPFPRRTHTHTHTQERGREGERERERERERGN